jgi:hypothetical protein
MKKRIEDLKSATLTEIYITSISDKLAQLEIVGEYENAEKSRLQCLSLLDEMVCIQEFFFGEQDFNILGWIICISNICSIKNANYSCGKTEGRTE